MLHRLHLFIILQAVGFLGSVKGWSFLNVVPQKQQPTAARPRTTTTWTNENVIVLDSELSEGQKRAWNNLVPLWEEGCDIRVEWIDPRSGAEDVWEACCFQDLLSDQSKQSVIDALECSLEQFRMLVQEIDPQAKKFRARILATRGKSGTKCPRWHCDYVPLRWIQSWVGPGCEYVLAEDGVNRTLLNQWDDTDENINDKIVDPAVADTRQGRPGQAVILKGNKGTNLPAVHKSPELAPMQPRVLMILDIVLDS